MRGILISASVALVASLIGTPLVIRFFRRRGYGQLIRDDGPQAHFAKRGTPTMGGHGHHRRRDPRLPRRDAGAVVGRAGRRSRLLDVLSAGGLLAIGVFAGMGAVGFLDDYIKIRRNRSLGLTKTAKFTGQALVAGLFAVGAEYVAATSTHLSFIGATDVRLRPLLRPVVLHHAGRGVQRGEPDRRP